MIQRLITDITSGNLRKQKAALESGLMLDDIDLYDEEDNDLVAIRRAAAARRRRLLKKKGGDILENLSEYWYRRLSIRLACSCCYCT